MDIESKVDEMRGLLHEMKPVIAGSAKMIESIDQRQRTLEIKHAETDVRLGRAVEDIDRLGKKVREHRDVRLQSVVRERDETRSRWVDFLEAIVEAPRYLHVIFSIGSMAITVVAILWKRHQ